jgi:very-short-patch-repair endonuclease
MSIELLSKKEIDKLITVCVDNVNDFYALSSKEIWELKQNIKNLESPIEQMMYVFLETGLQNKTIQTQTIFKHYSGDHYRVDFQIFASVRSIFLKPPIIVECDGKNYHENKPYQIRKDRKRDRFLMSDFGCKVFRFSGDEIYAVYEKLLFGKEDISIFDFLEELDTEIKNILKNAIKPECVL